MKQSYKKKSSTIFLIFLCVVFLGIDSTANSNAGDISNDNAVVKQGNSVLNEDDALPLAEIKKCEGTLFKKTSLYPKKIKSLCQNIAQDGREQKFSKLMDAGIRYNRKCCECVDFFYTFKKFCNSGGKNKNSNDKQREPNLLVLDLTDQIFRELASDDEIKANAVKPIVTLIYLLRNFDAFTNGEKEYFEHIALYVERHFEKLIKQYENNSENEKLDGSYDVDDLFKN